MKRKAREATKIYHQKLYAEKRLFQKGSWLEKPNETVISLVRENLLGKKNLRVLDLGSGVGRNAIPLAKIIGKLGGKITCVDYLNIAIEKLNEYAIEYNVKEFIDGLVVPIEDFVIKPNTYDYIIAHSVLTHTVSKEEMIRIIKDMVKGTKNNGINYICEITNSREIDVRTGEKLDPDAEVEIIFKELKNLLERLYKGWTIQLLEKNPYKEEFEKTGRKVTWYADYLSFIAKKKLPENLS